MIASGITAGQLQAAAALIGVTADVRTLNDKGTRHRVKINPLVAASCRTPSGSRRRGEGGNAKYQRVSASTFNNGARVHAVCWHGFRDYFRACFVAAPKAVFRTSMDTWSGSVDFEARYRASGLRNIGSQMAPMTAAQACCCCPESGEAR